MYSDNISAADKRAEEALAQDEEGAGEEWAPGAEVSGEDVWHSQSDQPEEPEDRGWSPFKPRSPSRFRSLELRMRPGGVCRHPGVDSGLKNGF